MACEECFNVCFEVSYANHNDELLQIGSDAKLKVMCAFSFGGPRFSNIAQEHGAFCTTTCGKMSGTQKHAT